MEKTIGHCQECGKLIYRSEPTYSQGGLFAGIYHKACWKDQYRDVTVTWNNFKENPPWRQKEEGWSIRKIVEVLIKLKDGTVDMDVIDTTGKHFVNNSNEEVIEWMEIDELNDIPDFYKTEEKE